MICDVSVVIPVRNRPEQIRSAVRSIRGQTQLPREIVVVDDASTDDTPDVVRSLAEGTVPVRLVALGENRGGGYARNVGIDAAEGDLLAFLDSDDLWLPHRLEAQMAALKLNHSADFLCFSNLQVDRNDGSPVTPWNTIDFQPGNRVRNYMLDADQAVQTSTFLMPTATARRIRFDDRLRRHQDLDFVFRADRDGVTFIYVPEVLVHYSADVKTTRTSQRRNVGPSLAWMEIARDYLTDQELARFYLKHVYDIELTEAPLRALSRGSHGVLRGWTPIGPFLRTAVRILSPERLLDVLRLLSRRGTPRHGDQA